MVVYAVEDGGMRSDEEQEVLVGTINGVPTVSCTNINNVDGRFL